MSGKKRVYFTKYTLQQLRFRNRKILVKNSYYFILLYSFSSTLTLLLFLRTGLFSIQIIQLFVQIFVYNTCIQFNYIFINI